MAGFYMKQKDWNTIINYAKASVKLNNGAEIGGMLVMQKDEDDDYILKNPVILKQEVAATSCEMDKAELSLFYNKAHKKYKKKGLVRYVWWHSHANMKAYFSGTDDKTILAAESDDFTVSLVVNVKAEYALRVQYFQPIECADDDVELIIMDSKSNQLPNAILEEVKAKATKKTWSGVTTYPRDKKGKVKDTQLSFDDSYDSDYYYMQKYNNSYSPDGQQKGVVQYQTLVTYMDSMNSQLCSGQIKYDSWKRAIKGTNEQLIERKCDWTLEVLTEEALDEVIMYVHPNEFVTRVQPILLGEKQ